jgi:DNA-binding FrmR family transcriptional regulator
MKKKQTDKSPVPIKRRVELDVLRLEGQIQSLKERLGFTDWRKVLMLAVCIEGATDRLIRDLVALHLDAWADGVTDEKKLEMDEILKVVLRRM